MNRFLAYLILSNMWIIGSFLSTNDKGFMSTLGLVWLIMSILVWWGDKR